MRGQQHLEAMRHRGHIPAIVFVETDPSRFRQPDTWANQTPDTAHLHTTAKPDRAALRCVVGLTVSVHGTSAERVHAMRDACIEAKAKRVIATLSRAEELPSGFLRFETTEVSDTEGVMTWPNC